MYFVEICKTNNVACLSVFHKAKYQKKVIAQKRVALPNMHKICFKRQIFFLFFLPYFPHECIESCQNKIGNCCGSLKSKHCFICICGWVLAFWFLHFCVAHNFPWFSAKFVNCIVACIIKLLCTAACAY